MGSQSDDLLSPELRNAEREIDTAYLSNPLVKKPFAVAAWRAMAFFEDLATMDFLKGPIDIHRAKGFADYLVNHIQYPLYWLFQSCPSGGESPNSYDEDQYQFSKDLADLADSYEPFVSAFTYASRGLIELELDGRQIKLAQPFYSDSRYDAYDWLVRPKPLFPDFSQGNIIDLVARRLRISGEQFSYDLGRKFVQKCSKILAPIIEPFFELPSDWQFSRYSLMDFRAVARILVTMGYIHHIAHIHAAMMRCKGMGYSSSLILFEKEDFITKLARYSNISLDICSSIIEDLTFGSRGIRRPDPALQPVIPLNSRMVCLMPNILANSAMERNLISLINRIPEEREVYLRLVDYKEDHMRSRAIDLLRPFGFRFFSGHISNRHDLPDIDLAIISDEDKKLIAAEFKWFIDPAEPNEVIQKSEEISRGIEQLISLSEAYEQDPTQFHSSWNTDASYDIYWMVLSQNSIGDDRSQSEEIPVIYLDHFLNKLTSSNINAVCKWAHSKDYLPVEGSDFRVVFQEYMVANWKLEWFGMEPLRDTPYQ